MSRLRPPRQSLPALAARATAQSPAVAAPTTPFKRRGETGGRGNPSASRRRSRACCPPGTAVQPRPAPTTPAEETRATPAAPTAAPSAAEATTQAPVATGQTCLACAGSKPAAVAPPEPAVPVVTGPIEVEIPSDNGPVTINLVEPVDDILANEEAAAALEALISAAVAANDTRLIRFGSESSPKKPLERFSKGDLPPHQRVPRRA